MPVLRSGTSTVSDTEEGITQQTGLGGTPHDETTVPTTQLTQLISIAAKSARSIRAPRFSEQRDLSEYLHDFCLVAERNGWSDLEAGIELQNSLDGSTLTHALAARPSSCSEIIKTLREKLIPTPQQARRKLQAVKMTHNDVDALASQCTRLTRLGYGQTGLNVSPQIMEEQKIEAFMEGLRNRDMIHALGIQRPESMDEAVKLAKEFLRREEMFTRRVRCLHCEETDQQQPCIKQTQATASGNGQRPRP